MKHQRDYLVSMEMKFAVYVMSIELSDVDDGKYCHVGPNIDWIIYYS